MKTLIASALVATAALTGVASAQVGTGSAAALAHFNQDYDAGDRLVLNGEDNGVQVSTRSGIVGDVFDRFNAQADSQDDVFGLNGATLVSGTPAYGAGIFADIAAESAEDE